MKFVLISLMSICVVTTHQYFRDDPTEMPWLSPYSPHSFINKNQPIIVYYPRISPPTIYSSYNEDFNKGLTAIDDGEEEPTSHDGQREFPDARLRVKGFNDDRSAYLNQQQNARFFFLTNGGVYTNPFLKTATFTSTISLAVTSIISCVPANQVLNGAAAVACRRKRSAIGFEEVGIPENNQFSIAPSETSKLMATDLASSPESKTELLSSKDDIAHGDLATRDRHSIDKRFFPNKNQFVVSTTLTTYAVSSVVKTVTVNLLNPAPAVACEPVDVAAINPQCVACLPAGLIVCTGTGTG